MIIIYGPTKYMPVVTRGGLNAGWSWGAVPVAITYGHTLAITTDGPAGVLNASTAGGGILNPSIPGGGRA